jgi:hypothetical protein
MRFEGSHQHRPRPPLLKHPVHHTNVEVDVFIEAGAESVNEGDGTDVQVHMGRTGAVVCRVCAITRRKMRSTMLSTAPSRCMKYRNSWARTAPTGAPAGGGRRGRSGARRLHHAPGGARGADSPAFAGEGYKVVVPSRRSERGQSHGQRCRTQDTWQTLCARRAWGVVVALAVELTRAGQL